MICWLFGKIDHNYIFWLKPRKEVELDSNLKIAIFAGDFFWSSTPYESLDVYESLSEYFDCDYIMFENDIRLNKNFKDKDRYYFDKTYFQNAQNLRIIKNWEQFAKISKDYNLILVSTHIAPKTRWPFGIRNLKHFKSRVGTKIIAWDIGGSDILTNAVDYADYFFTKGPIWTEWLTRMGKKAFTTGAPQYDYFLDGKKAKCPRLSEEEFCRKYSLDSTKDTILILPSNPGSALHNDQLKQNLNCLNFLTDQGDINVMFKTYPNDYLYYESDAPYSGVYRRVYGSWRGPQYNFFECKYPTGIIVESQDHHAALMHADKVFNIAGSHVAWETVFTRSKSFTMNYSDKPYFRHPKYLPEFVNFPDSILNYEIRNPEEALEDFPIYKRKCEDFILKEYSIPNMVAAIQEIMADL